MTPTEEHNNAQTIDLKNNKALAGRFFALSDPTRLKILDLLCTHGPKSVGDITSLLGISSTSVSHHLSTLEEAELIVKQKERNYNFNYPQAETFLSLMDSLAWWKTKYEEWGKRSVEEQIEKVRKEGA